MSIDDEFDEDDIEGTAEGLPFIINQLLFDQYGSEFTVTRDASGMYLVSAKNWKIAPSRDTRFSVGAARNEKKP